MSVIENMIERRQREVFTLKSVVERVDVEVIIKDKQGRILKEIFKDCVLNETAQSFENDRNYLEIDFTLKGEIKNYSKDLQYDT
jgi:hypothetical protein